jgi:hypothetical protein
MTSRTRPRSSLRRPSSCPALLTAFGREPTRSLDAIAVFRRLSRQPRRWLDLARRGQHKFDFISDDEHAEVLALAAQEG